MDSLELAQVIFAILISLPFILNAGKKKKC